MHFHTYFRYQSESRLHVVRGCIPSELRSPGHVVGIWKKIQTNWQVLEFFFKCLPIWQVLEKIFSSACQFGRYSKKKILKCLPIGRYLKKKNHKCQHGRHSKFFF